MNGLKNETQLKMTVNVHLIVTLCVQALLNNSYLYHMAHGKDFESRGIESKRLHWISSGPDGGFTFSFFISAAQSNLYKMLENSKS